MANTPGFFQNLGSFFGGGGPTALQELQNNGYSQYQPTAAPNVSGNFKGYQGAQANTAANQPYQQAQSALLGQLGSEASGTGGPTVADQQLQAATGQALAAQKASMAGARGQNAGLASAQLGTNLANTTAGAAGQAGAQRAQEQENAQSGLGGLTQGAIGQGNQLAEANQASTNQGLEATSQAQQNYGNLQNQDWQFGNNLGAQQQAQQNALVGQQVNGQIASNNSAASSFGTGLLNTGLSGAGMLAGAADGAVVDNSWPKFAASGIVIPSQASNTFQAPGTMNIINGGSPGGSPNKAAAAAIGGIGGSPGGLNSSLGADAPSSQALSPGPLQSDSAINPEAGSLLLTDPSQGLGGGLGGAGGGAAMGDSASAGLGGTLALGLADGGMVAHPMADGGIAAPVAHGPEKAIIGENGPEAVVPLKENGDVDMARARNPAVQQLLESHPGLRHIQDAGTPQGQPTGTGDRATAAALAMAGAHLSDRVAALEQLLSSQARKSQRRAA